MNKLISITNLIKVKYSRRLRAAGAVQNDLPARKFAQFLVSMTSGINVPMLSTSGQIFIINMKEVDRYQSFIGRIGMII